MKAIFEPTFSPAEQDHYSKKIRVYYTPLARICGVSLDPTTKTRWAEIISLGRQIDNAIDVQPNPAGLTNTEDAVLNWLERIKEQQIFTELADLAEPTVAELLFLTEELFKLNRKYKSALSIPDFVRARAHEGAVYADIILTSATKQVQSHPDFPRLQRVVRAGGIAANLGNSALGLSEDYSTGQISIPPTLTNSTRILTAAFKPSTYHLIDNI